MYEVNMSLTKARLPTLESVKGDIIKDDILRPLIKLVLSPIGVHVGVGTQRPCPHSFPCPGGAPDHQSLGASSLE